MSKKGIENEEFRRWDREMTIEWVRSLGMSVEETETVEKMFRANEMDGAQMVHLTDGGNTLVSTLPKSTQVKLFCALKHLKKNGKFEKNWGSIFSKLAKSVAGSESVSDIEAAVDLFSKKESFRERYFQFFVDFFRYEELETIRAQLTSEEEKTKCENEMKELKDRIDADYMRLTGTRFFEKAKTTVKLMEHKKEENGNSLASIGVKKVDGAWKLPLKLKIWLIWMMKMMVCFLQIHVSVLGRILVQLVLIFASKQKNS